MAEGMETFVYITQNEAPTEALFGPFRNSTGPLDSSPDLVRWLAAYRAEHDVLRVVVIKAKAP